MISKKSSLMVGVSGIRGIVGETLTPEVISCFGAAFGTYMNSGRVVVGRDTRVSGPMIKHLILGSLTAAGCEVIDLGIVTTPTCSLMAKEFKAAGAVIITGSHNPVEWNALKFLKTGGLFLNEKEGLRLLEIYNNGVFKQARWDGLRTEREDSSGAEKHLKKILANIDVKLIRKKRFKVTLDSCNGAGSLITQLLLKELGCQVIPINCKPDGLFPHNPEPISANLQELCKKVKTTGSDAGFAQDPDADRLAIIDSNGRYIGEEYSVALAADYLLKNTNNATVVVNMSTSMALDDIAKKHKARLLRTKVGEVHVAERMIAEKALIGGEGNGGVMWPQIHPVRDSLAGISLTLQNMAENNKTITELAAALPAYYIVKEKISCNPKNVKTVMTEIKKFYSNEKVETIDGITITGDKTRISVRPSNTEPIFRIFAESDSLKKSEDIAQNIKKIMTGILKKLAD